MRKRYPLDWPLWAKRTPPEERRRAQFGAVYGENKRKRQLSNNEATERLLAEIRRYTAPGTTWRADPDEVVISTNVPSRRDGLPRSGLSEPEDPGVCVYFTLDDVELALPCDTFDRVADNIAAVAGHIEADRRQERYGVGSAAQRFAGFKALPERGSGWAWWEVLDVGPYASRELIERAYRLKTKEMHPDAGGDTADWYRLQEAYRQALSQHHTTEEPIT